MRQGLRQISLILILIMCFSLCSCTYNCAPVTKPEGVNVQQSSITSDTPFQSDTPSSSPTDNTQHKLVSHHIDVGQGDCQFIELPNGECMLIDAGEKGNEKIIISYIQNLGYTTLDYVVCTHPHSDHIGSMEGVLEAFAAKNIYMPKKAHTSKVYINLLTAIKNKNYKIKQAKSGVNIISSDDLNISFVSPTKEYEDINNSSAVIRLDYLDTSFLYTGDVENTAWSDITANIDVDVLKVSHHGSSNATSSALLSKITPKYAVISCGEDNSYGHPHTETVTLLKNLSVPIYRTDTMGNIIITSDGNNITVTSDKSAPPPVVSADDKATATDNTTTGNDTDIVYKTKTGKRYHRAGCSSLKKSCIQTTRIAATKEGLTPCGNCNP